MDVDFTPLLEQGIQILTMILLAVGSMAVRWFLKKTKLQADAEVRAYFQNALYNGIELAAERARKRIAKSGHQNVNFKSQVIGEAMDYVVQHVPDARKHFNLTDADLMELIEARAGPMLRREEQLHG